MDLLDVLCLVILATLAGGVLGTLALAGLLLLAAWIIGPDLRSSWLRSDW